MTEQEGIELPWQPEAHKPTLPFVICTNGEGHYWIGRYRNDNDGYRIWEQSRANGEFYEINTCDEFPLAWIEPEKFVPFMKKKKLHECIDGPHLHNPLTMRCWEEDNALWTQIIFPWSTDNQTFDKAHQYEVNFCPFCGFKAGEK